MVPWLKITGSTRLHSYCARPRSAGYVSGGCSRKVAGDQPRLLRDLIFNLTTHICCLRKARGGSVYDLITVSVWLACGVRTLYPSPPRAMICPLGCSLQPQSAAEPGTVGGMELAGSPHCPNLPHILVWSDASDLCQIPIARAPAGRDRLARPKISRC